MTSLHRGVLYDFDAATWTANVQLDGSEGELTLPVGEWVPSGMLAQDDVVAVLLFDDTDTDAGVILGPYGGVSGWSYPALTGLTTGQPLRATSATAAAFGALDLANANAVTGALPHGKGGTGLSATPTNGQLPIGNGSGFALATLTGTANRVTVTNGAGTITLSGPQDLHTTASPSFTDLTLSGQLITASAITAGTANSSNGLITGNIYNSTTNALLDALILNRYVNGTAADGLGGLIKTQLEDSAGNLQKAMQIAFEWATAATGTRKSRARFFIEDTATREAFRIEASGTAPMIGFLGANASARAAAYTVTNLTADRAYDANATSTAELADVLGTLIGDLRTFGLIG